MEVNLGNYIQSNTMLGFHESLRGRITVDVTKGGNLHISDEPPIAAYFGKLKRVWLDKGEDAAEYARKLRNDMQHKL